ncbi:DUF1501 domain-containing protein [Terrabacter sp. RAF57]|uniref:DUF1501 domain-containing protein n=1 Tax=Terrabacter sp. RAF57 TaxID=3233063 RepID=UPI003F974D02
MTITPTDLTAALPGSTPEDVDDAVPAEGCGCPQGQALTSRVSRRTLLAGASTLGALGAVVGVAGPSAATQLAFAGTAYTGDTIVILSLRGGFDGLSAVAPVGDPAYFAARPTIAIPASRAIRLDSMFGLHPALAPLKPIWDAGGLAAVHAVGQVNPTRSHFDAMATMENAAPGSTLRTGWLDRMIGLSGPVSTFASAAVGTSTTPQSMIGPNPEVAIRTVDTFSLLGADTATEQTRWTTALNALYAGAPAALAAPAKATLGALSTMSPLKAAGYTPANGAAYPKGAVGDALRDLARLIKARIGLRAATIDLGNWDMHSGLGSSDSGWMFRQLTELGQALAAFNQDLGAQMSDVTLVTLSEFGRRVAENGSGGLDHGHGNVSLVMGGGLRGGKVYGRWPGLSEANLNNGDLAGATDYRTILAEALEQRAQLASATVFPGLSADRLGMFAAKA